MESLEDSEDPSSSSMMSNKDQTIEEADTEELAKFRQQWKEELRLNASPSSVRKEQPASLEHRDKEEEAAGLYWMGVAAEQSGDMHAAIMYYRQAVQLEPDIEFRVCGREPPAQRNVDRDDDFDAGELSDLSNVLQSLSLEATICEPNRPTQETHISKLPVDVLRYIFRWVVSAQLDMRSLEQVSMVCKGFYMLSREPQLWRVACKKLWSVDCIPTGYNGSWRRMYILKPHLHFNGVYISKSSYVRPGEHSLDGFYKPFHTVVFYRYLRFFADGSVMYQTSPEEPAQVVSKLCHKHTSEAVLLGEYTVQGNRVLVDVFSYRCVQPNHHQRGRGRAWKKQTEITHEQRFHMELVLKSGKRQQSNQLTWEDYYCHSLHKPTGRIQVSHFTIDYKYTPFFFSRVKRFTTNSMGIL